MKEKVIETAFLLLPPPWVLGRPEDGLLERAPHVPQPADVRPRLARRRLLLLPQLGVPQRERPVRREDRLNGGSVPQDGVWRDRRTFF